MNTRTTRLWSGQLLFLRPARCPAQQHSQPLRSFFTFTSPFGGKAPFASAPRVPLARRLRSLRFKSDKSTPTQGPNPTPHLNSPEPAPSLSQRLKKLSREYGWTALGVYMALTVLDFPFCFMAVRAIGVNKIGHYEHVAKEAIMNVLWIVFPGLGKKAGAQPALPEAEAEATTREGSVGLAAEVGAGKAMNNGAEASIWTQLALAYAVHKTFIFVRIPLTAALLPKVAKTLRRWGYNVGRQP